MENLEAQASTQNIEKNHAATFKQRLIFYSGFLALSALIGFLPLIPPLLSGSLGNMGMGGLIYFFFWWVIGIIDIIFIFIYEFTHLPDKEHIDFKLQKNISLIYLILSALTFVYLLVMSILHISAGSKIDAEFFVVMTPFLVLVLLDLWHYTTACKLNAISRKLAIITTIATLALIICLFFLIPETIKSYNHTKNSTTYLTALNNNDLKTCLAVQNATVCKRELGIKYNDPQLCLQIPDSVSGDFRETERYTCLYTIAMNTKNEDICTLISETVKDKWNIATSSCIKGVLAVKQKEITAGLTDEQITEQAVAQNNFDLCLAISHIDHNRTCQLEVAKLNTVNYCEKIDRFNSSQQRLDCYEFHGYQIPQTFLHDSNDTDEDKLFDHIEKYVWKTDPQNPDTDADGYSDGNEVANGYDPLKE